LEYIDIIAYMKKFILPFIVVVVIVGVYFINNPKDKDAHMDDGHSMAVSSDREFITMMIPHHQEAIDTSKKVLASGGEIAEVKKLAEAIIVTQESEITEMKSWYSEWFGEEYKDTGVYMEMMRDLSNLFGRELDIVFTTDMIAHHEGAIEMANHALGFSNRNEIISLSQNIIETQQEEITSMQDILSENK